MNAVSCQILGQIAQKFGRKKSTVQPVIGVEAV